MKYTDPYLEAMRYIQNAEELLEKAGKDGKFFVDEKYVKSASGVAYSGILFALDRLFEIRNVPKKRGRKAIEHYQEYLAKIDKKLLNYLNSAYNVLHLDGHYGGERNIKVIEAGFDSAISIIEALKPYSSEYSRSSVN